MAYSTTNLYPEDLNGTNPLNLIKNEVHNLQVPGPKDFYFIIPHAAPFFVDSLKVINVATGLPYEEGPDYLVGHRFVEAMDSLGRPVAGSIRFMRFDIVGQVRLEYRTIGGNWGFSDAAIIRELTNKKLNPLVRSWGDIDVLPYSFPVFPHDQPLDKLVGSKELNDSLINIAAVLEASASGTTQSHLVDYDNPHRVTAFQVGLGNVPNLKMATDQEHIEATRNDLFTNPRGVLLLVQEHAIKPLNAHIQATGNVHDLVPADINLGNVPNFPAATAAQAIDPTNNSTLLTPYTGSLLIQKLSNDPRLDQLLIDFNNHITANNPHEITPGKIGTYTSQEIDKLIHDVSISGGDAETFNGETPEQWEDKFPSNMDINTMLTELGDLYQAQITEYNLVDMEDPVTPGDIAERKAQLISWAFGAYAAYGIFNSLGDLRIVGSSDTTVGTDAFPKSVITNGAGKWVSEVNANYYIQPDGSVKAWGSAMVPLPPAYVSGPSFTYASRGIWSSRDHVWLLNDADGKLNRFNRTGVLTAEPNGDNAVDVFVGNGMTDVRPIGIARKSTEPGVNTFDAIGDTSWITAVNAIKTGLGTATIHDIRVATEYLNVIVNLGTMETPDYRIRIYKINFGGSITLTDVTNTIDVRNHTTAVVAKADTIRGVTQLAGSYTHFVFTLPRSENTDLCDLLSFGDNSQGQLEIPQSSAPFLSIAAGYQYTITINRMNFVEFWGNSPDNSLIYRGGAYIPDQNPNSSSNRPGR